MQSLTLDPPVPYPIHTGPVMVGLVGCGGTGSFVAQSLARIAAHLRATRSALKIVFIDGDTVEEKNVGRQLFSVQDIGRGKAQVLAARFSALFGLAIDAVPEMATVKRLRDMTQRGRKPYGRQGQLNLLIGAVDSVVGRRAMAEALASMHWDLWLDCGNHESSGQVVVGSETDPTRLCDAVKLGICSRLPAPSLVYPALLETAQRRRREDCAAAMEDNVQSLCVNQAMAAVASEYLSKILITRRLTTFETVLDLGSLAMRSTPITARTVGAYASALGAPQPTEKPRRRTAQNRERIQV